MGGKSFDILQLFKPAVALLPEVGRASPQKSFKDKAIQTVIIVVIYLVCSQIPLYGIVAQSSADQYRWLRIILASNKGSLMELGISPLVTAGMIMQLLAGAKIINVNNKDPEHQALFQNSQKVLGVFIALFEALAYTASGSYGSYDQLGFINAVLIVLQLTFAGVIVQLLDELISKGHGLGNSAISLFIAINMCENILWRTLSPLSHPSQFLAGNEYEGSIINLFHSLIVHPDKFAALQHAFYRQEFSNISNLISTVMMFFVVIYFQGFRVDLPMVNPRVRGYVQPYPIQLFYTSNTPIILQSSLLSSLYFISQLLYKNFGGNFLVGLLGTWQETTIGGRQIVPVGGLVYYMSPPNGITDLIFDPFHCIFYIVFIIGTCGLFSKLWIQLSGSDISDVMAQLRQENLSVKGQTERGTKMFLRRYINTAALLGGMCIGALSIVADFMGVIGSGTGMLLSVTIIHSYFELFKKEQQRGLLDLNFFKKN